MLPELSLQGKTAVVTGGGRGIGREIALALAEAGSDVVVAARTSSEIEATAADIRSMGRKAIALHTDVSKSDEVDSLAERALEHFGKIDVLVNNAGKLMRLPARELSGY